MACLEMPIRLAAPDTDPYNAQFPSQVQEAIGIASILRFAWRAGPRPYDRCQRAWDDNSL
jgi:hypothetical protein